MPIRWTKSRDEVWQSNVPHTFLATEKSDQHWMVVNGQKVNFPGGGTHFPNGADKYISNVAKVCLDSVIYMDVHLKMSDLRNHFLDKACVQYRRAFFLARTLSFKKCSPDWVAGDLGPFTGQICCVEGFGRQAKRFWVFLHGILLLSNA